MANLRESVTKDSANRDLSPSQREALAHDAIEEYQKTEIIRQSIKNVQRSAEE